MIGAGIAVWALAGSLNDDGAVSPTYGYKNMSLFTYTVTYTLDPNEEPPDVIVIGYLGGNKEWEQMMSYQVIGEIYVHYTYTTTLPYTGNWSFKFQVVDGETSHMYPGPYVDDYH